MTWWRRILRRVGTRLMMWACVNRLEGRVEDPDNPPQVVIYVFEANRDVGPLLVGMGMTYQLANGYPLIDLQEYATIWNNAPAQSTRSVH